MRYYHAWIIISFIVTFRSSLDHQLGITDSADSSDSCNGISRMQQGGITDSADSSDSCNGINRRQQGVITDSADSSDSCNGQQWQL